MINVARLYWDTLRGYLDTRLEDVTRDLWFDWPRFVRWSILIAVLLVGGSHLAQASSIGPDSLIGTVVVTAVLTLASLLVALQVWALWQTHLDATQRRPYVVALLLSALTISCCTEAFAGLTLWLANHGWLVATGPAPTLWDLERFYVWHLLNAVPLLSITETLGWPVPIAFNGVSIGALVLAFTIVLIVPLVRVAIAGYELLESTRLAAVERQNERDRRRPNDSFRIQVGHVWGFAATAAGALAVLPFVLPVILDPSSALNQWLAANLAPGFSIRGVHVPLAWMQTTPQWLTVLTLGWVLFQGVDFLYFLTEAGFRSISGVVSAVLSYLGVLILLTLTGAAAMLVLLHVELVYAQPAIPPHDQLWTATTTYVRAILDAVPGVDVLKILNWIPQHRFVGVVNGILVLAYKIAFIAILVFPIARVIRAFVHRTRPRRLSTPALAAPGEFVALLRTLQSTLDEAERGALDAGKEGDRRRARENLRRLLASMAATTTEAVPGQPKRARLSVSTGADSSVEGPKRTGAKATSGGPEAGGAVQYPESFRWISGGYWSIMNHFHEAETTIQKIETVFEQVTSLFGEGEERAEADRALTAALLRERLVSDLHSSRRWGFRHEPTSSDLKKCRAELAQHTKAFRALAAAALAREAALATEKRTSR